MNKEYKGLKILHLILMVVAMLLCFASIFILRQSDGSSSYLTLLEYFTCILTLIAGFIYLAQGSKKSGALYYKFFMIFMIVSDVLHVTNVMAVGTAPHIGIINVLALIVAVLLAFIKDFGKTKTILSVTVLIVCKMLLLVIVVIDSAKIGNAATAYIFGAVVNFLVASTAGFMVLEKYIDKNRRLMYNMRMLWKGDKV